MKQHISTYSKGMNKDISMDSIPSEMYLHAEDIRFFTDEGESLSAGINIKGTTSLFQLTGTDEQVIGYTTIRNKIIFFTADNTAAHGRIYELIINDKTNTGTPVLIYDHPAMGFSKLKPIEAVGRSEDSCTERVVFSDYDEYTRSINILDSCFKTGPYTSATSYCGILPVDLDIFQGFCFNNPTIDTILGGGNLLTGMYQYAFKLVTRDGKETLLSQASSLVSIYPKTSKSNINLAGDEEGTVSGKSVRVEFNLSGIDISNINNLIPVRLFINTLDGLPQISQFPEIIIDGTNNVYTFIDSGDNLTSQITNEQYILNNFIFKTNKTFGTKDNILLYSNIKESCFELDCINKDDFVNVRYRGLIRHDSYINSTYPSVGVASDAKYVNPYNDESGSIFGHIGGQAALAHTATDWQNQHQFKYQDPTSTLDTGILGGTTVGGFLTYKFCLEEMNVVGDNNLFGAVGSTSSYSLLDGYSHKSITHNAPGDPVKGNEVRGYKRGEVYRFGVVFFSKEKGQPSFVYPIGDIKMPSVSQVANYETIQGTGVEHFPIALNNKSYALGVDFTLNLPTCVEEQICGYQIVRVERTQQDKNFLSQGIIKNYRQLTGDDDSTTTRSYVVNYPSDHISEFANATPPSNERKSLISFFSPEVSYNFDSPEVSSGDYLKTVAIAYDATRNVISGQSTNRLPTEVDAIPIHLHHTHREPIKAGQRVYCGTGDRSLRIIDTDISEVRNYSATGTAYNQSSEKGTFIGTNIVCQLQDSQPNGAGVSPFAYQGDAGGVWNEQFSGVSETNTKVDTGAYVVDYSRYLFNQYGGRGYSIISRNAFHPVTNLINKTVTNTKVYQGDTFIAHYDFATHLYDDDAQAEFGFDSTSFYQYVRMPIETSINLDLTHGITTHKGTGGYDHDNDDAYDSYRFKEINNKNGNMFEYNTVFSQTRKDKSFFAQPLNYDVCGCDVIRDVRSYISDPKINGETLDSWSNVRVNNFLDVDSQYGAINRLLNLKDEIYYLQDNGFGRFLINPRAVISTNVGPTELGTGQGLQDYHYISTKYGCKHQWACVATEGGLYYFDSEHKKIYGYAGQNTPVSDIKGFHGFLNYRLKGDVLLNKSQGGDNPIIDKGVHCTFDYNKKELVWTFLGTEDSVDRSGFTLVLDEKTQSFSHFLNHTPRIYLNDNDYILSSKPLATADNIHVHETGVYGSYYGDDPVEAMISVVVNTHGDINKILRYIEFNSTVNALKEKGSFYGDRNDEFQNTLREETITGLRIYNEHQDSGKIDLSDTRQFKGTTVSKYLQRKFDKWRVKIPRNNQLNDSRRDNRLKDRFRSTYFVVELYYQNNGDKEFRINRVISHYDAHSF